VLSIGSTVLCRFMQNMYAHQFKGEASEDEALNSRVGWEHWPPGPYGAASEVICVVHTSNVSVDCQIRHNLTRYH